MRNLTMRWTAVACCALSACLFAPGAARAQGSPPPTAVDDDVPGNSRRAAELYREGNEAFKEKRWSDAELLYLKAWALVRSFDIAANLGEVQLKLNKPRSAALFLAFSLRATPPSAKPPNVERVRRYLDEARKQVGAVRVRVTNVPDAEVFVDGERVPAEEVEHEIYVEPGEHRIVIRRAGYEEVAMALMARAGVRETVPVAMKPVEAKAPEAKAPEASEAEPAKLPEGPIVAPPAGRAEGRAGGPREAVLIGGAATAGAAAVAGVVFTVLAVKKGSDAEELRDSVVRNHGVAACSRADAPSAACADVKDAFDVHRRWTNVAFWSFVGAGAAGAGTLIYGLATKPSRPHGRVVVTPLVGAGNVGISVAGAL